jgi:K+-transporting ATPase c subunit
MADTLVQANNKPVLFKGRPQREQPRSSALFNAKSPTGSSVDAGATALGADKGGTMPWTGKQFASRHNKSLSPAEASAAASQASAMVNSGVDEGIAIATANKRINRLRKAGRISDRAHAKHLKGKHGGKGKEKNRSKTTNKQDDGLDAATR